MRGLEKPAGLDLLLAKLAGAHVLFGAAVAVLQHADDVVVGKTVARLDLDRSLDARRHFACGDGEKAVGVDLEGHADAGGARSHRRNAAKLEAGERTAGVDELALALNDVDRRRGRS